MKFFLSTNLSIEIGCATRIYNDLELSKRRKLCIVYDSNLKSNEYFKDVYSYLLKGHGEFCIVENSWKGEPTYDLLEDKIEPVRKFNPDLIFAIGGGSTLDLAKGLAILNTNKVPALKLKGFPVGLNRPTPYITIPSILGSGSEISFNAVFIDTKMNKKLGINYINNFPYKTFIDPLLSMSAPMPAVISSAMDSLVHCIDSFGSPKATPLSKSLSITGFKATFDALINSDIQKAEERMKLALGSVCGTAALMNSGDGPTNGFAYYFGVKDKIPHGLSGGIFLKEVIKYNIKNGYLDYWELVEGDHEMSKIDILGLLIENLEKLYIKHQIPQLSEFGYTKNDSSHLSKAASEALLGSFNGNPIPFTEKSAEKVLDQLL